MSEFAGQVAVVTGAGSGIGKAMALALASRGASVALVGRTLSKLKEAAAGAPNTSGRMAAFAADLAVDDQVTSLCSNVLRDFGYVDILVHSASFFTRGTVEAAPVGEFDAQYRTNVRAPYLLTQGLLSTLKARKGQVVFINSTAGKDARASVGQYAATKHALNGLAESLREEVNPYGVRVLSLFLGRAATPMQAAVCASEGRPYRPERLIQPEDVAAVTLNALSLARTAEVMQISIRPMAKPE